MSIAETSSSRTTPAGHLPDFGARSRQQALQQLESPAVEVPVSAHVPEPHDTELGEAVKLALQSSPYPLQTVSVRCSQRGHVSLGGDVASWHLKQMAQEGARRVSGVLRVTNIVQVVRETNCVRCEDFRTESDGEAT